MIRRVLWINWLNLKRDRVALGLTFILPLIFYSIFAVIFGSRSQGGTSRIQVVVLDQDRSEASQRFIAGLQTEDSFRFHPTASDSLPGPQTREDATEWVRSGNAEIALVIPQGFGASFGDFLNSSAPIEILTDSQADPIAAPLTVGLVQKAAMTAMPDLMIERGLEYFEKFGGALTPAQRESMNFFLPRLREQMAAQSWPATTTAQGSPLPTDLGEVIGGPVSTRIVDVLGQHLQNPVIAFYAAATAVMFLLFAASGAGGTLLDEEESGALQRLLTTRLTMTSLLAGKWLFLLLMGSAQIVVMFLWAWAVFGLELWTVQRVSGFLVMTLATAGAAAAFGLVFATACRSRAQLGGLSTIVILIMSAVGGSMFPRFLMPEWMQNYGLLTFNAWALDGYQKVFWRGEPILQLWPQVGVLLVLTLVFLAASRWLARRWEAI